MRRRSGSLASLREGNRRRVVDALRERGLASRADLARMTGLSRSTISTLVTDLLESGLAVEREDQSDGAVTHAGRPPVMVSLDASAGLAVGIDFGHRHLRVAVSDLAHDVLAEKWRELDVDHSAQEGLDVAADFVDQVMREAGGDLDRVIGVVMGLPAPIDRETGAVQDSSILPGWVGVDAAAQRLIGDAGRALGIAVANLCNILNPECVIVGGDVSAAGDVLLDPMREAVRRNGIPSAVTDFEILAGTLGERAEMLGALALVMHESERFQAPALMSEAA